MGSFSIWHWLVVGAVALMFFGGRGKISEMMGDVAKGIKAFKKGMADDETPVAGTTTTTVSTTEPVRTLEHQVGQPTSAAPVAADRKIG